MKKLNVESDISKLKYLVIIFGLSIFFIAPYLSLSLQGISCMILVGLGAYFGHLKGGIVAAFLLSQGLVFGALFKYQSYLRERLKEQSLELTMEKDKLNKILYTTMDGFLILNTEGEIIEANKSYQEMIGYSREELLEMTIDDIDITKNKEEVKDHMERIMTDEQDRFETKCSCKNGEVIDVEVSTTYIDDLEEPIFVSFDRDITERKKTEQTLKESEAKFRSYIDNAPYGVFVINSRGEYIEVNEAACELSGYSKEELLNMSIEDVTVDRQKAKRHLVQLLEVGELSLEIMLLKKDGSKFHANINAVKASENRLLGFVEDITARKEAEEKVKEERDKLQKYFDITEVIVVNLDRTGKVELLNRKGCEILGVKEEEVLGHDWTENFVKEEDSAETKQIINSLLEGEIINDKNRIITKSGEERKILWHNAVLKDEQSQMNKILSTGIDITEVESLKEKVAYNKLKMEFFANISHEFRTPLNLIFSAQQMLEMYQKKLEPEQSSKMGKYTTIIKQNGRRLLRLANNLIDITKMDSGSFELELENCNIVSLVRKVACSVAEHIEYKELEFEFDSEIEEKIIACDPFNIERVILNLLSNAVKFTDIGDKVSVNIYTEEGKVLISVKDTGIGISQEKQELIFKRFGQADKSFTRSNEGTGIGLSIVKSIVELHNGQISVESEEGVGSEFIIELSDRKLAEGSSFQTNDRYNSQEIIDRIDVEFADIYDL
ncbi:sensor histidine kinase [Acetohalobium arabaticum]|uniref:histidine kinase n=1 Tax=Acetohalobium arabaticum (strain ATCC 49924 / DSM 5501 / Z-7288) TaxID=574087 RepID=D9QQI4_ACEAZ|nr:PAS domain-containing sensor histidine kinase [Acetohalobium arabaticum]ADL12775.1 multi-sensor signal transduction histidine kinase [Acetohalobium arabaticum DSM 5501]